MPGQRGTHAASGASEFGAITADSLTVTDGPVAVPAASITDVSLSTNVMLATQSRGPQPSDSGALGWVTDPMSTVGTANVMAAATIYVSKVPFPQGGAFSIVDYAVVGAAVGAAGSAHNFVSVYDSNGNVLAQSADQAANWTSIGPYSVACAGNAGAAAAGKFVWVAWYMGVVFATTQPAITRCFPTNLANIAFVGPTQARFATIAQADNAVMQPFAPASLTKTNGFTHWAQIR